MYVHKIRKSQEIAFSDLVDTETKGVVRLIGINRAEKRNCVNNQVARQLIVAFENFDNDPNVKVAVFYGKGPVSWWLLKKVFFAMESTHFTVESDLSP